MRPNSRMQPKDSRITSIIYERHRGINTTIGAG